MNSLVILTLILAVNTVNIVDGGHEGVCFKKNPESPNHMFAAFPKDAETDSNGDLHVKQWSLDGNEQLRCACPVENDEINSLYDESGQCPCQCSDVPRSFFKQIYHTNYQYFTIGFQIRYNSNDKEQSALVPAMQVFLFSDGSYFTISRHSKLLSPKSAYLKLSEFKPLKFEKVNQLTPFYEIDQQKKIFRPIFHNSLTILSAKHYRDLEQGRLYLTPQQLVRVREEHMINGWKLATRYNFNVIPVWNVITAQRNKIQDDVLTRHGQPIKNYQMDIVSGISGAYTYPDENGAEAILYLKSSNEHGQLVVPYYLWNLYTVINDKEKKESIFLIIHNDPNVERAKSRKICDNSVCENYRSFENIVDKEGEIFAYCCRATRDVVARISENLISGNFVNMEKSLFQIPFNKLQQRANALKKGGK